MRKIILLATLVIATSVQAEEIAKCNEHGALVTLTDCTVLYLGKQCDATREGGGPATGGMQHLSLGWKSTEKHTWLLRAEV